ncbi:hypothetical protein [Streptomyces sp. NP-1717]|uniref:hypothetical protein n=1 Tax=Streptomyces sp. NP-1717 TaxID=2704470 RepID=UPI001F5CDF41|nr:hypothetical protein [Streptomyces sp. NP-1717]MCI3225410.1 hypothetical protein [Streptomyces sp. NP-1717]
MTVHEINEALSAMARCSMALLGECDAEQTRMEKLDELSELGIEQRAVQQGARYEADSVLLSVRLRLANKNAENHRAAAREFVSWWVDVATTAWKSAVLGTPLLYARVGAAAPNILMAEGDLAVVPTADDLTRQLVEFGAFLDSPLPGSTYDHDENHAAATADLAACSGLLLRRDATGEVRVVDDEFPEARRRRLWGGFWVDHRIPAIPQPDELDFLLGRTPPEFAKPLRAAAREVIQAAMAGVRVSELGDSDAPWTGVESAEFDRLSEMLDRLTALLAVYAQAITNCLPAVRAAEKGQSDTHSTS